jgi:hypothetical protein
MFKKVLLVLVFLISSCSSKDVHQDSVQNIEKNQTMVSENKNPHWSEQMQKMSAYFFDLLPLLASSEEYAKKENKNRIEKDLTGLSTIVHGMGKRVKVPDQDPSIPLIVGRFQDNLNLATESFRTGHVEFSRGVVKNSLSQCVQCHTRIEYGPQLNGVEYMSAIKQLNLVDRVQFLIASRSFNEAHELILSELKNSKVGTLISDDISSQNGMSVLTWQRLFHLGLVITVRFKDDPKLTNELLKMIEINPNTPYFIKRDLATLRESIEDWRSIAQSKTAKSQVQRALAFIEKGEAYQRKTRSDSGLILFLAAARSLHEAVAFESNSKELSEALFQLGLVYDLIGEMGTPSMAEDYFELCIRKSPHTETSKKCFAHFEQSQIEGFSGTSGIHIPQDIQTRINELRSLTF